MWVLLNYSKLYFQLIFLCSVLVSVLIYVCAKCVCVCVFGMFVFFVVLAQFFFFSNYGVVQLDINADTH